MSYVRTCRKCEKPFRAMSFTSKRWTCDECSPRVKNLHRQIKKRSDEMSKDAYKRLREIEDKIGAIELNVEIQQGEQNTIVRDIETRALNLLTEAVEKKVEQIFDEKIALVDSMEKKFSEKLAIVNSRITKAFENANIPTPSPNLIDETPAKTLTPMQKRRFKTLTKFLEMRGTPTTKAQILEWAWQDVPSGSAGKLLLLGEELKIIKRIGNKLRAKKGRREHQYVLVSEEKPEVKDKYLYNEGETPINPTVYE